MHCLAVLWSKGSRRAIRGLPERKGAGAMCTETFLRLPEEKRTRILDAAWEEFTDNSFASASINRIVHRAEIPRGSFYQYFTDKSDLFSYLVQDMRTQLLGEFSRLLSDAEGDLFQMALLAYDRFEAMAADGTVPLFNHIYSVLSRNPGMDIEKLMTEQPRDIVPERLLENADLSCLREPDAVFARYVCGLNFMCLGEAVANGMCHPEEGAAHREALLKKLEIIRRGSLRPKALREKGALR